MVSRNYTLILENLAGIVGNLPLLSRGAESELRVGYYSGIRAVFKFRRRKSYMDPELDILLRRRRTLKEAKILIQARNGGVRAPRVLAVLPSLHLIIMEYISGTRMKDALEQGSVEPCRTAREAGELIGRLHAMGIVHGDPTTSNFILSTNGDLYIIDFGLSDYTSDIEDLAVDLHLFRRASTSSHPLYADTLIKCLLEGYRRVLGRRVDKVIERAEEISLRGRYVEERRKSVWSAYA